MVVTADGGRRLTAISAMDLHAPFEGLPLGRPLARRDAADDELADALSALIAMLRPRTVFAKLVTGRGRWGASYGTIKSTGFGLVLKGQCYVSAGGPFSRLQAGDFVLMPPTPHFSICSDPKAELQPVVPHGIGDVPSDRHHGDSNGEPDFELLGGYFWFDPANAAMLPYLLPSLLRVRGGEIASMRLQATIELLTEEATTDRPGRELIVPRLVEVILIEALRFASQDVAIRPPAGLLEGLADANLASALRAIHANASRRWTLAELARNSGLSRSSFCDRFARKVGMPPMEYLFRWRMALAKEMLRGDGVPLEKVAVRLGYQSASAFSAAFSRAFGLSPSQFARSIAA